MHDRQHLFHLQYITKIYAEDVIVTESEALARMTAQAAQSCEAQALLHLCRNKSLGAWEALNAHGALFWLLGDPGVRQPQPRSLVCTATRLRCFILSEAFAFPWKNRSPYHLQPCSQLLPIRDLFEPSMTTSRTKPLSFLENKMMGLEESTYVDLILMLHYGADEWGQHPDSGAEKCCQLSLNLQFLKRYPQFLKSPGHGPYSF